MNLHQDAEPREELESHLADQAGSLLRMERFFWHRLRSEFALRAIRCHVGSRPTVLDVGAGAGVFGSHFADAFPQGRYMFVEPVEFMAGTLRKRFGREADLSGKSCAAVDAVVLLDVLEHQEQDVGFLVDLCARLRPGAWVILTCPALQCLWSDWDVKLGHYRRYDRRGLKRVLAGAGLEILDLRYMFPSMVLPGFLRRVRGNSEAEFPQVGPVLNEVLYAVSRMEQIACPWAPFGSSLAAVGRTPGTKAGL